MAWFKRNRDEPPADDAPVAVAPEQASTPDAGLVPDAAAPAWTTAAPMPTVMPTIQRALGKVDARSVTALGRPAPLLLAPLGHAVTPDAPAGVVGGLTVNDPGAGPATPDQPPLEYVQRAPAGSPPPRPAAPAQLLVPSFQPNRLPQVPVVAPDVQRSPASPFTTAPSPEPPLVLPVGDVLSMPVPPAEPRLSPEPEPGVEDSAPGDAPLLAGSVGPVAEPADAPAVGAHRAPAAELPLAPVQRHADHPGHVDGDEAPAAPDDVQRAPVDAGPPAPIPTVAPLLAEPSPRSAVLPAAADRPADAGSTPVSAPDLPLAPVQRHADHPGHVEGDAAPDEGAGIQRAPSAAPLLPAAATDVPHSDAPHRTATEADLPLAGVQRAPAGTAPAADAPLLADAPIASTLPAAATDVPRSDAPHGAAATEADLPLAGVQRAPGGTAPVTSGPPTPPHVDLPLAPVQRHADHPGHVEGDEAPDGQRSEADAPAAPAPTAPLVGDAAPLASVPPAAPPAVTLPPATSTDAFPSPDMPLPAAPVQRRAAPRRPGLGRPIDAVPTGAVEPGTVQRAPLPPAVTVPLVGTDPIQPNPAMALAAQPPPAADDDAPAGAGSPTSAAGAPGFSPELELVQRAPLGAAGPSAAAGTTASSSSSAATPVAATRPPLVVAPLLGGRPFATQVQRAAAAPTSAPAGLVDRSSPEALSPEPGRVYQPLVGIGMWNGAPPPDFPGPAIEAPPSHVASAVQRAIGTDVSNVRIRRDTGPTAQRLEARVFTSGGEVHIPASVGSLDSGEGASLATHELVHAGQQSVLGSSRPHEHTPEGQHLEAQARSAEHASLAGLVLPSMPLVPPPAPTIVQRAPSDGGSPTPFSPQQLSTLLELADNPRQDQGGATVQRFIGGHRPASEAPVAAPPSGTPAAAADKQQTPQELEELATKLFPALRNLFRSELLGFRRRSGTSSDRPLS